MRVWYISFSTVHWWTYVPLLFLFWIKGIPSSFLVWIPSLLLLYSFTFSLWVFFHSLSFWKLRSTCRNQSSFLDFTASSSPFQIFYFFTTLFISTVFPLFNLLLLFFFFLYSFSFHSFSFFFSFFCFCYPNFPCFNLHCFPHFLGHLVIFTSSVFQLISGLW